MKRLVLLPLLCLLAVPSVAAGQSVKSKTSAPSASPGPASSGSLTPADRALLRAVREGERRREDQRARLKRLGALAFEMDDTKRSHEIARLQHRLQTLHDARLEHARDRLSPVGQAALEQHRRAGSSEPAPTRGKTKARARDAGAGRRDRPSTRKHPASTRAPAGTLQRHAGPGRDQIEGMRRTKEAAKRIPVSRPRPAAGRGGTAKRSSLSTGSRITRANAEAAFRRLEREIEAVDDEPRRR